MRATAEAAQSIQLTGEAAHSPFLPTLLMRPHASWQEFFIFRVERKVSLLNKKRTVMIHLTFLKPVVTPPKVLNYISRSPCVTIAEELFS